MRRAAAYLAWFAPFLVMLPAHARELPRAAPAGPSVSFVASLKSHGPFAID